MSEQRMTKLLSMALALSLLSACSYDFCTDSLLSEHYEARKQCLNTPNCAIDVDDLRQIAYYEKRCRRVEQ